MIDFEDVQKYFRTDPGAVDFLYTPTPSSGLAVLLAH
jgi:hypothetical protein